MNTTSNTETSNPDVQPIGTPPSSPDPEASASDSSSSSVTNTEEEAIERAELNAAIRESRRAIRRSNQQFARLLARCTPEILGTQTAMEIFTEFGAPHEQHLASSEGSSSSSDSSSEDEETPAPPSQTPSKFPKGPGDGDGGPPSANTVSVH